ncbi:hypothetical protein [Afipia carboxidovorans]|nr:hypothetical protein [Afipia carboxidovorans]
MKEFTLEEKLEEIEREIAQRHRVYPRLVAAGKLRQTKADKQMALMIAVRDDYRTKISQGPLFREGNAL